MLARSELYRSGADRTNDGIAKFGVRLIDYGSYLIMKLTNQILLKLRIGRYLKL